MSTNTKPPPRPPAAGPEPRPTSQPRATSLGREMPRVPRRYGQWAGAVLFVVMAVLLAGWFWQQRDDRSTVLAVTDPVAAGEVITAADLEVVDVSGVDGAISSRQRASVVGSTAAVGLVDGQVLTGDMITTHAIPGPDQRVVGMQLDSTRAPTGLQPGDVVNAVAVPPAGNPGSTTDLDSPVVLVSRATIATAESIAGAGTRFTLLVPDAVGDRLAAYVAAGRVALVQAPVGGDN